MTQPFYTTPPDVMDGQRIRPGHLNNIDAATETGFKNVHDYAADTGAADVYVVTLSGSPAAYYDGMRVSFRPSATSLTTTPTINVNGLGAKSISSAKGLVGLPAIGEIVAQFPVTLIYSTGTAGFVLQGGAKTLLAPGPIGSDTPSTGAFTTLSASSTVSGNGVTARFATPGPIGNTSASTGAFTTLSASSTVAGAGFSDYLASPPAIGGTAPAAVTGTTVTGTSLVATTGGIRSRGADNASATNFAAGEGALDAMNGGLRNTAVGYNALTSIVNGLYCTAFGYEALKLNTGNSNTACGHSALAGNLTGTFNSAFGMFALETNGVGYQNTAAGYNALQANAGGYSNTAAGYYAGATISAGNTNSCFGQGADVNNASAINRTVIGAGAIGASNNQVVLGNASVTQLKSVGVAIPAGGTAGTGFVMSSTANFGVFFGSGAPSLSAAKGSLYLRSDGSATNDRMYVNTDGSTTWTAVTTAA